jgi:hypothetical protein
MTRALPKGSLAAAILVAGLAFNGALAAAEEPLLPLGDEDILKAFEDLEKGRLSAAEVERRCLGNTAADKDNIKGRLGVAGFLSVEGKDAGPALCGALVHAVDSRHLAAQELRDFMQSDNEMHRAWSAGRVLREIYYAHEARQGQS